MSALREKLNDIELEISDLVHMAGMTGSLAANMFTGPNNSGLYIVQKYDRELLDFALRDIGARAETAMNRLAGMTEAIEAEEFKGRKA